MKTVGEILRSGKGGKEYNSEAESLAFHAGDQMAMERHAAEVAADKRASDPFLSHKIEVAHGNVSAESKVDELIGRGYIEKGRRNTAIADFKAFAARKTARASDTFEANGVVSASLSNPERFQHHAQAKAICDRREAEEAHSQSVLAFSPRFIGETWERRELHNQAIVQHQIAVARYEAYGDEVRAGKHRQYIAEHEEVLQS